MTIKRTCLQTRFPRKWFSTGPVYPMQREISKQSFLSPVRPSVHKNLSDSQKRSSSKTVFKPQDFENAGFGDEKHFENYALCKRWRNDNHVILLSQITNWMPGDCCVSVQIPPAYSVERVFELIFEKTLPIFSSFGKQGTLKKRKRMFLSHSNS